MSDFRKHLQVRKQVWSRLSSNGKVNFTSTHKSLDSNVINQNQRQPIVFTLARADVVLLLLTFAPFLPIRRPPIHLIKIMRFVNLFELVRSAWDGKRTVEKIINDGRDTKTGEEG